MSSCQKVLERRLAERIMHSMLKIPSDGQLSECEGRAMGSGRFERSRSKLTSDD